MTNINIPFEVVRQAAIELYYDARGLGNNSWEEAPAWEREDFCRKARLVVDAALNAWPGRDHSFTMVPRIVLPLPQENPDDQG